MLSAAQTARATTWPGVWRGADPSGAPIDPNGNLTSKTEGTDTWTYTWNAENELTKVEKNSVEQARFSYDPLGRRVEKVTGAVTTSYTYERQDILRELRGGTTLKYIHGPRIDEPIATDDGAALTYHHADGLGSVVKQTNSAGTVTLTRQYDAWGRLETGAAEPGYAFTGREWDPDSLLYYYRARYYEPMIGRFVSEDPSRAKGGLNFYAYVKNHPVNYVDPSGLERIYYYYVCCFNERMSICGGPNRLQDSCLRKCALEHEAIHLEDLRPCYESFCKGKPDKTPVTVPEATRKATECRGADYTRECIKKCRDSEEKNTVDWGMVISQVENCGRQF